MTVGQFASPIEIVAENGAWSFPEAVWNSHHEAAKVALQEKAMENGGNHPGTFRGGIW